MRRRRYKLSAFTAVIVLLITLVTVIGRVTRPPTSRGRAAPGTSAEQSPVASPLPVPLIGVVDGDTIRVQFQGQHELVRLLEINTPETGKPGYRKAAQNLSRLLGSSHTVDLEFETPGQVERDQYGRLLCYVFARGRNVNVEQVRAGHSRFWTKYGRGRYAAEFRAAEQEWASRAR